MDKCKNCGLPIKYVGGWTWVHENKYIDHSAAPTEDSMKREVDFFVSEEQKRLRVLRNNIHKKRRRTMSEPKWNNCPFCGAEAAQYCGIEPGAAFGFFLSCNAQGPSASRGYRGEGFEARELWNQRSGQLEAESELMKKALLEIRDVMNTHSTQSLALGTCVGTAIQVLDKIEKGERAL